jgi:hypothetical protein
MKNLVSKSVIALMAQSLRGRENPKGGRNNDCSRRGRNNNNNANSQVRSNHPIC